MNTTATNDIFTAFAEIMANEAPSEKARSFVEKLVEESRLIGVEKVVVSMGLTESIVSDESVAPIEDNRLYWLARWQEAVGRV